MNSKERKYNGNKESDSINDPGELSQYKSQDVFAVPSGYFDELPSQIQSRVSGSRHSHRIFYLLQPRPLMIAALFVAAIISGIFFYTQSHKKEMAPVVITYEDLYNMGMLSDIDNRIVSEHYFFVKENQKQAENTHPAMNDYLIENDIDLTLIMNEL